LLCSWGYSNEATKNAVEPGSGAIIETAKTFATEEEFLAEHERLLGIARDVAPAVKVETRYYAAGDETPKYSSYFPARNSLLGEIAG
jgi:hypothetical protein